MLKVTIELISATTGKTSEIGRMFVANTGEGSLERGDYSVAVCRRGVTDIPHAEGFRDSGTPAARTGAVLNYPRLSYNVWRLISRAILSAFPEEQRTVPGKAYATTISPEVVQGAARVLRSWMRVGDGSHAKELAKGDPTIQAFMAWITESVA